MPNANIKEDPETKSGQGQSADGFRPELRSSKPVVPKGATGQTKIRINLDLPEKQAANLEHICDLTCRTKTEVIRLALELFDLAVESRQNGKRLCLVDDRGNLTEIYGLGTK